MSNVASRVPESAGLVRGNTSRRSSDRMSETSALNKPGEDRSPIAKANKVRRIALDVPNDAMMKVRL